jgi:hypothetical protein
MGNLVRLGVSRERERGTKERLQDGFDGLLNRPLLHHDAKERWGARQIDKSFEHVRLARCIVDESKECIEDSHVRQKEPGLFWQR